MRKGTEWEMLMEILKCLVNIFASFVYFDFVEIINNDACKIPYHGRVAETNVSNPIFIALSEEVRMEGGEKNQNRNSLIS